MAGGKFSMGERISEIRKREEFGRNVHYRRHRERGLGEW
jgi:hypothetical protein